MALLSTFERNRRGFTVIELLLVVAIIGVLLLLTFSVTARMRNISKGLQCMNQLRETGRAMLAYAMENNGTIRSITGGESSYSSIWSNVLFAKQYLPSQEIVRCPLGKTTKPFTNGGWMWQAYGLNMQITPNVTLDTQKKLFFLQTRAVETPAAYPLLMDSATSSNPITQSFRVELDAGGISFRHNKKANVFFLDGHMAEIDKTTAEEQLGFTRFYNE